MSKIYQLKITLDYIKPPIWRRVEVAADTNLEALHEVIQMTMGWQMSHLWRFEDVRGTEYVDSEEAMEMADIEGVLASKTKLSGVLKEEKDRLKYEYDFGDGWEHTILLEKIMDAEAATAYPRCTGGARACPPEDCGGFGGYEELCELMKKPKSNAERKEMIEWLDGEFDAEEFDLEAVNAGLGNS